MKALIKSNLVSPAEGIFYFDNFITEAECQEISYELSFAFWQPSTLLQSGDGNILNAIISEQRVSHTAHQYFFSEELNRIISKVEGKIKSIFNVSSNYLEPWQATKYPLNGKLDYHLDAGYWKNDYGRERVYTFLLYISSPEKGGATHFRALDIKVEAKAGRLLVWENLFPNGQCNHRMIHAGQPLELGNKLTLVTWNRQNRYRY